MGSFDTAPSSGALTPSNLSVHSLPTGRVTQNEDDEDDDEPQLKSVKPIIQVQKRKPTKSAPPTHQNAVKESAVPSSSVGIYKNVVELNAKPLEEIPSENLLPSDNPVSELSVCYFVKNFGLISEHFFVRLL